MFSSEDNAQYNDVKYWNERYSVEDEYEWLGDYDSIR